MGGGGVGWGVGVRNNNQVLINSEVYTLEKCLNSITRETLSNNNPCPSSPSSTILRSAYMALNTLQQDWLL